MPATAPPQLAPKRPDTDDGPRRRADAEVSAATTDAALPSWIEHRGHAKVEPLAPGDERPPEPFVAELLAAEARRLGRAPADVRVLDLGCGRGERVSWLLEAGWDAWGADIVESYLDLGRAHVASLGRGGDRLRRIDDSRSLPFDAASFDVVLSDQVLEHVADLDAFACGVAAVTAPGGAGLHVFPARFRPIEPHMRTPVVHWLPKGRGRRMALSAALRTGWDAGHFDDLAHRDRLEVFARFSKEQTFYRSERALTSAFGAYGLRADATAAPREKLRTTLRARGLPGALAAPLAWPYRTFSAAYLQTRAAG